MILPFSTQLNGKPTYFVEKILKGLYEYYCQDPNHVIPNSNSCNWLKVISDCLYESGKKLGYEYAEDILRKQDEVYPKFHTFRQDKKNRWKNANIIDFFINTRTKEMFRFAPKLPVLNTQEVEIRWSGGEINTVEIWIDKECYVQNYAPDYNWSSQRQERMETLAHNDGFDTVEDFLAYFNTDFTGKIIHWTDKKY